MTSTRADYSVSSREVVLSEQCKDESLRGKTVTKWSATDLRKGHSVMSGFNSEEEIEKAVAERIKEENSEIPVADLPRDLDGYLYRIYPHDTEPWRVTECCGAPATFSGDGDFYCKNCYETVDDLGVGGIVRLPAEAKGA